MGTRALPRVGRHGAGHPGPITCAGVCGECRCGCGKSGGGQNSQVRRSLRDARVRPSRVRDPRGMGRAGPAVRWEFGEAHCWDHGGHSWDGVSSTTALNSHSARERAVDSRDSRLHKQWYSSVIGRRTSRHFNFSFHELCEVDFGLLHKELNIRQSFIEQANIFKRWRIEGGLYFGVCQKRLWLRPEKLYYCKIKEANKFSTEAECLSLRHNPPPHSFVLMICILKVES